MKTKWVAYPHLLWMIIFIVFPLFLVVYYAFTTADGAFTLENFVFAFSKQNLGVIADSLRLAFECTIICFFLGYPVAYILSKKEYDNANIIVFLFIVPMWMNFLLRTYGWLTLIDNNGVINNLLGILGMPKLNIINTEVAILLGMVYNYLPFMILPIYNVLKKMDTSLIEAAQDLGANPKEVITKLIFPLSVPGVISGITMVFMPSVTTFVISNLLGGGKYYLIGNLIENQFLVSSNWNYGSALSIVLMAIILFSMAVISFIDKDNEGGVVM